jgi:DNA-binding FadR family transcriptional regulator
MIEQWCARAAIARGRAPVAKMRAAVEIQRGLSGDAKAFIEADRDFHALLIASGGNDVVITQMYEAAARPAT